jgi:hypothetical protein
MTSAIEVLRVSATPSYMGGGFTLRFPPDLNKEILPLLDEHELAHGTALELSAGPADWIEMIQPLAIGLGGLGGLHGVAAVIKTIVHRNDGKKLVVKIGDEEIQIAGFSDEKVIELLQKANVQRDKLDAEVHRKLGQDPEEGS